MGVLYAYRGFLIVFLVILLTLTVWFAIRWLTVLAESGQATSKTEMGRAQRSRQNLTRLVLIASALLFCALVVAILTIIMGSTPTGYYGIQFALAIVESMCCFIVMFTFFMMMRNRMDHGHVNSLAQDSDRQEPLIQNDELSGL